MKKLKFLLPILAGIFIVSACNSVDFGDINKDDDAVMEPSTEGLMAAAMNNFFGLTGRIYLTKPNLYVQYQSQNVYTDEQRYNQAPGAWSQYFVNMLNNLDQIVELTTGDDVSDVTRTFGALDNQRAVAEIFSAVVWKRVTDTYGPVPYTQALSDSVLTPAYTDQKTIYKDLIARVKAARDLLDASKPGPTGDALYGGDVTKWKKFANSFLLSLTLQLSETDLATFAEAEFKAALNHTAGVIDDVSEEMWYDHVNVPGSTNPFSSLRGADYNMSEPLTKALSGTADGTVIAYSNSAYDARFNVLADTTIPGRPYGYNEYPGSTTYSNMSEALQGEAADSPYMTAAYTYLNRAEAAALGWTTESAAAMLEAGIIASYASLEAHLDDGSATTGKLQTDGTTFAANRVADATTAGILQVIGEEKWIALYPNGFAAWSEWRRTGYPGLVPSPEPLNNGKIPTRYIYPTSEKGVNKANYQEGVGMLSPAQDNNTAHVWWDQ